MSKLPAEKTYTSCWLCGSGSPGTEEAQQAQGAVVLQCPQGQVTSVQGQQYTDSPWCSWECHERTTPNVRDLSPLGLLLGASQQRLKMLPWILSMKMRSNNHTPGKQASSEKLQAFPLFSDLLTSFLYLKLQTKVIRSPNIEGESRSPHLPNGPARQNSEALHLGCELPKDGWTSLANGQQPELQLQLYSHSTCSLPALPNIHTHMCTHPPTHTHM